MPHRVSRARRGAAQNLRAQLGVEFELFETLKRAPVRAGAAATGVPGTRHRSRATDKECNRRLGIYTHSRIIIRLCLKAISASVTPTVGRCSANDWPKKPLGGSSCFPVRAKWARPHCFRSSQKRANSAIYVAGDGPEATLPGFWERLWSRAERVALTGRAIVLLDEAHSFYDWTARLKGECDRLRRRKIRIHVIATGSSALRLSSGSRESLAGRFEKITLTHWTAASLAATFGMTAEKAALQNVSSRREDAGRNRRHPDGIGAIKLEAAPRCHRMR